MDETGRSAGSRRIADYVAEHAPELDPGEVEAFMGDHPLPEGEGEGESHVAWAVRVLRERGEGEVGEGLPVDRVVDELRNRGDG